MKKSGKKLGKIIYFGLVLVFLYLPILALMVLSFNSSKSMTAWTGFSLKWYEEMFSSKEIMDALGNTISIALWASLIATVIGVLACLGLNAMSEKKRSFLMGMNNIPLLNADIVTGISIMMSFLMFGISLSYGTVLFAHITFSIPYVILSVMPKLKQMKNQTYEAALDLGAKPLYAFYKVVLPELMPGIVTGFMLAFTMSVDDFVITHFTRGTGINTLSTLIYSQVKMGIRPALFALSTVIFVIVFLILVVYNMAVKKQEKLAAKGEYRVRKTMSPRRVLAGVTALVVLAVGVRVYSNSAALQGSKGTVYVYCFGDYIDPSLMEAFEEKTGYRAVMDYFDTNEEMYPVVKNVSSKYDVICASDYMIDKMRKEGLLQEINPANVPNMENISEDIKPFFDGFDPKMSFSVPHTWGTYGIIYNTDMVDEEVDSWSILWDEKYKGEIVMPDSVREAYMIAAALSGYSMNTTDEEEIKAMTKLLIKQKPLVYTYKNDNTRDMMIGNSAAMGVITSGDFVYAQELNESLEYAVPKEGTEVWVDSWAIPAGAANKEGAEAWLNFMLDGEVAAVNFEYLYYAIPNVEIEDLMDDPILRPDSEILARCETIKNLGSDADALYSRYWKTVKGE